MLNGMDDIDMTLEEAELIKTFEVEHKATQPWLFRG
jgi:3-isopropylmalate/(R)-2-methylmalate dehydratase small subunit